MSSAAAPQLVVATEGEHGSRILTKDGRVRRHPVAGPEREVVDSNGAGDAFSSAFMSRLFAGRPRDECMRAGAVSGASACGAHGTHEEQITADELDAALDRATFPER
jgi:sugar/nucleoside kinase (ribokinase family)